MQSNFSGPVNIGSDKMISMDDFMKMVIDISGKKNITINHIDGPLGVNGRNSDNNLIQKKLGWSPSKPLYDGMKILYDWIYDQYH
jgi:nucleoside-diphosphate-sugar epimerase